MNFNKVKTNEQKLKESEEKFRTMSEQSLMGIAILQDDRYKYVNQAAADMLGYTVEELLDTPQGGFMNYIHPEDREFVREQATKKQMGMKDVIKKYPNRGLTKSGETIWVQNYSCTITFEGKYADLITMVDFTERKKAEEAHKESEARFKGVFESKLIGVFFWDTNGDITDANDVYLEMVGYSKDEVLSGAVRWRDLTPPKYTDLDNKALEEIATTGVMTPIEKEYIRKDGSHFPILVGGSALPGSTLGGVSFALDITERKKGEQIIINLLEQLRRINIELEQFTYVASHDLKEPLRMILNFARLLARRYKGKLDEDADDFIDFIVDGAMRMQKLIDALLSYSRIGRSDKQFRLIDVDIILEKVIANLRHLIEESNTIITTDPLPKLVANEVEFIQLFQNLISNAIKFHGESPPLIHISAKLQKK